jgi:hypothetical protein
MKNPKHEYLQPKADPPPAENSKQIDSIAVILNETKWSEGSPWVPSLRPAMRAGLRSG